MFLIINFKVLQNFLTEIRLLNLNNNFATKKYLIHYKHTCLIQDFFNFYSTVYVTRLKKFPYIQRLKKFFSRVLFKLVVIDVLKDSIRALNMLLIIKTRIRIKEV